MTNDDLIFQKSDGPEMMASSGATRGGATGRGPPG